MSISQEIQRIKTNIVNAYTVAGNKGATLPQEQNSANLATTMQSIPTGGSTPSVIRKDVNFFDYDGTLLHSYTLAETQALTELPELPSHDGLICQGWNWTLADIKAEGKETDVGAMYITDDGKTRLYIRIAAEGRMTVPLCFRQTVANGVEVDWGDGSTVETFSGSGSTNILPTHTYAYVGDYIITLKPLNNNILTLGTNTSNMGIFGSTVNYSNRVYMNMLRKVELGNNIANNITNTFINCYSLENITIPNTITTIGDYAFSNCYLLKSIIIPDNVTIIKSYAFSSCRSLLTLSISSTVTNIERNICQGTLSVSNISLPNNIIDIGYALFYECATLVNVNIPNNITYINASMFYSCYALSNLKFPATVMEIRSSAFSSCYGMKFYDFSYHTLIPTLANTNAFSSIPSDCKIIVPDNLYNDWIVATNWSTYASYIISKTDWEAMQNAS